MRVGACPEQGRHWRGHDPLQAGVGSALLGEVDGDLSGVAGFHNHSALFDASLVGQEHHVGASDDIEPRRDCPTCTVAAGLAVMARVPRGKAA